MAGEGTSSILIRPILSAATSRAAPAANSGADKPFAAPPSASHKRMHGVL